MTEEAKKKLNEVSEMLEEGVKAFRSSEEWKNYLTMQSRLPHYSFNNCILIMMQSKGQATMCQSFTGWKAMERFVKAGEKGMRIICPAPYKFPLDEPQIIGEKKQKEFIALFGAILKMRNLLSAFDDFAGKEIISERELQDYLGRYQDLRDEWKRKRESGEITDITDDIVFEIELIKQIEINIDYILMLVKKYHDSHEEDKEILVTIRKAVDASPELRSKKALIESFIAGINDIDDVMDVWRDYVIQMKEKDLMLLIEEERLKPDETRDFIERSFRDDELKTIGTDIDKIMPPVSRFGGAGRDKKKEALIRRLKAYFEKFRGLI